jgi:hypothetical protein
MGRNCPKGAGFLRYGDLRRAHEVQNFSSWET